MLAGLTVMLLPVPTSVAPQEPLYHFQKAPVPREPPFTESVVLPPGVTTEGLAVADVGAVLFVENTKLSVEESAHPCASVTFTL